MSHPARREARIRCRSGLAEPSCSQASCNVPSTTTIVLDYAATTVCPHINYIAEPDWTIRRDKTFVDKFSLWMQSVSGDLPVIPVFVTAYPIAQYSNYVRERIIACTIPAPLVLERFISTSPPRPYSTMHVRTGDSVIVEKTDVPPAVEEAVRKVADCNGDR